ncbi:MAG: hypothetical protein ACFCVE_07530 [Phycisphaerae bacterium]
MPVLPSRTFVWLLTALTCVAVLPRHTPAEPAVLPGTDMAGRHLAQAVAGQREQAWDVLSPDVRITTFDGHGRLSLQNLRDLLDGQSIISARTYPGVPRRAASAVAVDASHANTLPAKLRSSLVPTDNALLERFDAAVETWIRASLDPGPGQSVALLVFWQESAGPTDAALWFILAKGTATDGGATRFSLVRLGSADDVLTAATQAE